MFQNLLKNKKQNSRLQDSPTIPISVYTELPDLLKECCSKFDTAREKDVFLTSALAIISGCLPNLKGMYDNGHYYPNLFALIAAPPASGKGVMKFAKLLGEKVHKKLLSDSSLVTETAFNNPSQEEGSNTSKKRKMLFFPANTSSSMFSKHLNDNDGFGIICESEADTLVNSFKQDWGNFSDQLRAAFHHETISVSRKLDNQYIEIDNPRLSLIITGTPEQIKSLIPSAENGLFSRNVFYLFYSRNGWKNSTPCVECNSSASFYREKASDILHLATFHYQNPMQFYLEPDQWITANTFFKEELESATSTHGDEAAGIVYRMGLIQFRIAMVLSALRNFSNDQHSVTQLKCTDIDFYISMELVRTYLKHSLLMLELIPKSLAKEHVKLFDSFYERLPQHFSRIEAVNYAKQLLISERSADRHLHEFVKNNKLEKVTTGSYKKP